jgi:16S rRNA processing protein RimM
VYDPDEGRVSVGYVRRAHGLRGEVLVRVLTDNPGRFVSGATFYTDDDPPVHLVVSTVRQHTDGLIVAFEEIPGREQAEQLQGSTLTIGASERRELGPDEYWPEDLAGLAAIDPSGNHLGSISGVVFGDAQDRLVVETPGGALVDVPFVEAIVRDVHPSLGHVVIDPPEGLFEL